MNNIVVAIFVFILGTCFASFYGVVISRVPKKMSIAFPGSHCFECGHELSWYENIPILSYIFSKGRCKSCNAKIGLFSFVYEILGAVLPTILYYSCEGVIEFAIKVLIFEIAFLLAGYDFENKVVLKKYVLIVFVVVYILLVII